MSRATEWLATQRGALDRILRRRSHYRATFGGVSGEVVLADLARFCGAARSSITVSPQSGMIDAHAMAVREGRREVFLYLRRNLNMDESKLQRITESNDDE